MDTEVVGTLIWKIYLARGGERSGCKTSSIDDAAGSDQASGETSSGNRGGGGNNGVRAAKESTNGTAKGAAKGAAN